MIRAYRIYFGGGQAEQAWIVQTYPELETVAAVATVFVKIETQFMPKMDGEKPNGVAIATGELKIKGNAAWIE